MKRLALFGGSLAIFAAAPLIGYAAYNDVTLTPATILSVGGISLNVSGTNAVIQSITTGATSLTLTLLPGSSISIAAPGKNMLMQTGGTGYVSASDCSAFSSQIGFSYPVGAGSAVTITVTPSTTTCGGGGAGGSTSTGGGSVLPAPAATNPSAVPALTSTTSPAAAATSSIQGSAAPTVTLPSLASGHVSPNFRFTRYLKYGSRGADVRALQAILVARGYLMASAPNGFYGMQTIKGVTRLQKDNALSPVGTVGPKTRAFLNSL